MQPWPPCAMKPSAVASSPDSWLKSSPMRGALLRHPHHVGGRVLDAGDVLQLEQPLHGVDRHVDHRTRRDVVDDDRNADRIVDRLEVLVEPFLGRLVVIGRHHQHGVGAGLLGVLRRARSPPWSNSSRRRRRPARGRAPGRRTIRPRRLMLVVRQRRAFAGGADRHQAVGALGDLPVDQVAERFLVDGTVLERRDQRGERASKARLGGHDTILGSACCGLARRAAAHGPPNKYRVAAALKALFRGPARDRHRTIGAQPVLNYVESTEALGPMPRFRREIRQLSLLTAWR